MTSTGSDEHVWEVAETENVAQRRRQSGSRGVIAGAGVADSG
jgi:hypothetical protein